MPAALPGYRYLGGGGADRIGGRSTAGRRWLQAVAEALVSPISRGDPSRRQTQQHLLDEQGSAYLSDFGIAGMCDITRRIPAWRGLYVSGKGRSEAVDRQADVRCDHPVQCLTGKKPYCAETALGVIVRHAQSILGPTWRRPSAAVAGALR
jgi:hypothetical protein